MKPFKIGQSEADIISHGGLALIGQAVQRYTTLASELDAQAALRHGITHSDVIKSYLRLMCQRHMTMPGLPLSRLTLTHTPRLRACSTIS